MSRRVFSGLAAGLLIVLVSAQAIAQELDIEDGIEQSRAGGSDIERENGLEANMVRARKFL